MSGIEGAVHHWLMVFLTNGEYGSPSGAQSRTSSDPNGSSSQIGSSFEDKNLQCNLMGTSGFIIQICLVVVIFLAIKRKLLLNLSQAPLREASKETNTVFPRWRKTASVERYASHNKHHSVDRALEGG